MLDAEALLLVDHHQTEVLEPHAAGEQPVGADDDVDGAVGQAVDHDLRLGVALEPGQRLDVHRVGRVPVDERVEVLLHQERRRHQHGHLGAVLHGLERRPHRDLGLAVADVAADQSVHRDRLLHVRLDLVDGDQLVRRLGVGERVLELALPGRVRTEGAAGRGHPGRVQPDQLAGDLPHRLAGPALGPGPVATAHLRQRRRLATHVLGHLVQRVGRHEQPVARLTALVRGVLDDQVLAGRRARARPDGALHELDEPSDAVLLVHHVVAGPQLQRVDDVAPPARHPPHVLGRRAGTAGQVGLAEHREVQVLGDEARTDLRRHHMHQPALGRGVQHRHEPGRHVGRAQLLDHALGRPVAVGGEDQGPARLLQPAHVGHRPVHLAPVVLDVPGTDHEGATIDRLLRPVRGGSGAGVRGERRECPPAQPAQRRQVAHVRERRERGRRQVERRRGPRGRGRPRGREELLGGGVQVVRPTADPLGVDEHEQAVPRNEVEHRDHLVDQGGSQGLHPLHRDARGQLVEQVDRPGQLRDQGGGPLADGRRQQDLPARRCPHPTGAHLETALVRHGEPANLLDLVAPQLDAQRVVLGRREDVKNPAAHRELPATLDHVDPGVRRVHQPTRKIVEVHLVTGRHLDRFEVAEPRDDRLQQSPHRHDEHPDRARRPVRRRMGEPAEHRQAVGHGVGPGRQPLVRERLPRGQHGHLVIGQVAAQRRSQLVAVPAGRGDDHERPAGPGSPARRCGQERRAGPGRADQVEPATRSDVPDGGTEGTVGQDRRDQTGEVHGSRLLG